MSTQNQLGGDQRRSEENRTPVVHFQDGDSPAARAWLTKFPPRFNVGDRVMFGRVSNDVREVKHVAIRQRIGRISGRFLNTFEYLVGVPGIEAPEESFIGATVYDHDPLPGAAVLWEHGL